MTHCKRIGVALLAACSALGLTAAVDAQTPTVLGAYGEFDSGTSNQYVDVTFSEAMNLDVLDPFNYSIAGYTILDSKFFVNNQGAASPNQIILQLNKPLTNSFTLDVNNVESVSGRPIAADTAVDGTLDPLSSIDIGIFMNNGTTFYEGQGSYLVNSDGQDICCNTEDGLRYVYTTRTNNFAVVVHVPYILPGDTWSKAGLMARETIDPSAGASRMVAIITTAAGSENALDGSGGGQNTFEMDVRDTTGGGSYVPGAGNPGYIQDYVIPPSWPDQWLLLTRATEGTNSDLFTAYESTNKADWTWLGSFNAATTGAATNFPSVVNVGMTSSAGVSNSFETASYENFGDYEVHNYVINSPSNVTVESGSSATFSVVAGSDGTFSMNGVTSPLVAYQWYTMTPPATNGVAVPGANASIYTIPLTTTNMSGMKVYCLISAASPFTGATNSATATLTVVENPALPTIVSALGEYDSGDSNQFVDVTFNEAMNPSSLTNPANYSIAGYTITKVMLFTNDLGHGSTNKVILQLSKPLTNSFTLVVSNVQSFSGVAIAADSSVGGTVDPLKSIDIGVFSLRGTTYYKGPGSYLVDASGQDIWNTLDGFRYVYTTRTNNFNVVVQVPYILPADAWSKASLMARETIDPSTGGSRMVIVATTPAATQLGLDGTYGTDTLSFQVRDTTNGAAYELPVPADYIGDYVIAPSYPNQWLLLTRITDGTNDAFTGYVSTNKTNWTWMGVFNPVTNGEAAPFPSVVNVGMATSTDIYTTNNFLPDTNTLLVTAMYANFGDYVSHVHLTNSPTNVTVESGTSATFSVVAGSDSTVSSNGVISVADYQWYTNGVEVPGATASTYITPFTTTNLNNEQVYCAISAFGSTTNSAKATLTVVENPAVPTMVSAFAEYDSGTTLQYVDIAFSEPMDMASILNTANYTIAGYSIQNAMLFTNNVGVGDPTNVILELNNRITGSFTLNVTNLKSISGIPLAASNTSVVVTADPLSSIDIGVIDWTGLGATYYEGPGSYLVNSAGQDIWNPQDGFRYVYTTRTNNFNVVVQVPFMLPADTWSKAGLMARETIDPSDGGSRMVAILTTPSSNQLSLDGSYGQNTLQMVVRDTNDGGAYEPPVPADYIGDYAIAPSFPNQWLLLTRRTEGTSDLFTTYASTNEADWTWVGEFNPVTTGEDTPFPSVVNVGMATSTDIYTTAAPIELVTARYENFGDYVGDAFLINSPTDATVESGTRATFSVLAGSHSTFLYQGATNPLVSYQWYTITPPATNGVAVPGATASIYTTPVTTTNLNGEKVYCAITAIGASTATNSATATLTVLEDTVPATIVSAFAEYDSGTSDQYVDVTFSKLMNVASLTNPANYSIAGYTITGAKPFVNDLGVSSGTMVILQLNKRVTGSFTLNVTNVQSVSSIATDTSVAPAADPLISIDIGNFTTNGFTTITTNGTTYYEGSDSYLVDASGNDIWNTQDGFRFVYTTRTNDFDVVVQVPSLLPADTWSKAGLMAREFIDTTNGGSRMIFVITTATATQNALDGSGGGQNTISMGIRDTNEGGAYQPNDYIGDYVIAPSYPNQWLRLTRQTSGNNDLFTAYASTDKVNWTWLGDFNPVTTGADTPFPSVVNVGMCTTAHVTPPSAYLATATYQNFGDYVAGPILTATLVAVSNSLTISWTPAGGSLYSSPVLNSTNWMFVTTNNPWPIAITKTNQSMFFKVISP